MTNKEITGIFKRYNALKKGHFLLTSGLHSEFYFQKNLVLQNPAITKKLTKALAAKVHCGKIDLVLSPAVGAIILGYEMASILKCRFVFAERQKNKLCLRRGFELEPGSKVLIAEDIITTGGSVRELIKLINRAGARVAAIACLVDRSPDKTLFNKIKPKSLLRIKIKNYSAAACPLCKRGVKLLQPGSRSL